MRITRFIISLSLIFAAFVGPAQENSKSFYNTIDSTVIRKADTVTSVASLANVINSSFTNEYQKVRSIFYWICRNISYSTDLMYTYSTNFNKPELVKETFGARKAICTGYSALADSLCQLCAIRSRVVFGSTRQSFLVSIIGHTWNAVRIMGEWQAIDATWGSGYIQNDQFIRRLDNTFFLPASSTLLKTHLPLDPIWQLSKHPLTLHQFYNRLNAGDGPEWNYNDSIAQFIAQDELAQVKSNIRRLLQFGYNSEIAFNYLNRLRSLEVDINNRRLNEASYLQTRAAEEFNAYVDFKNHQFSPAKPDAEIKRMLPAVAEKIAASDNIYRKVLGQNEDAGLAANINGNLNQLKALGKRLDEEQKFVNKYLLTTRNKRRDLFYTRIYTPLGKPAK